jgi:membrane-associated phospholipid phosphatase
MLIFPVDTEVSVYLFFLLSGLVGYARLTVNNHTLRQVYNGFMLGFVVMLALFVI